MLKQLANSASTLVKNTTIRSRLVKYNNVDSLCQQVTALRLTPRFFNSTAHVKEELQQHRHQRQQTEEIVPPSKKTTAIPTIKLSPLELLRKEALKIEDEASLRARCLWLPEEDEKLLNLINKEGKRWSYISTHFVNRPAPTLVNRYALLTNRKSQGPWTPQEVAKLKELGQGRKPEDIDNWKEIQAQLPGHRPLYLIKQKYQFSLNPNIKYGRWSEEESEKLTDLVERYGEKNMTQVAALMGSRTKRQCFERWKWQMSAIRKGRFTPEEDASIIEAVKKYGENFAVVAKVTGSERTARHISQHYRNMLAPDIDRSPWTLQEQALVYETCKRNNQDMIKTKQELNSKRGIRDLWNHVVTHEKYLNRNIRRSNKNTEHPIKQE